MKLFYFAWIKETVGVEEEDVTVPEDAKTVRDLIAWLETRSDGFAEAFREKVYIRVAVDQEHGDLDTSIIGASEAAFFPPITGG